MKILYSILLAAAFISTITAQTKTNESLSWKGVTIDQSSPEDTITKFGKPEKEETTGRLGIIYTKAEIFTQKASKNEYRVLKYKEIEQAKNVRFAFNKDNKLVLITFLSSAKKKLDVQAFLKTFDKTDFEPKEKNSLFYILFGKQQAGYILAEVIRGFTEVTKRKSVFDKNIEDISTDSLDGTVTTVQFISKSLENNDNTDVLK